MRAAPAEESKVRDDRRGVAITLAAAGVVAAAYGVLASFMARFLFPRSGPDRWVLVSDLGRFERSPTLRYQTPFGALVNITRMAEASSEADRTGAFMALSSTCPHLGCQVHWEADKKRYFCPCHNGVFDPQGVATEGPPAKAGQALIRYPLKVDGNLLFIELPAAELARLEELHRRGEVPPEGRILEEERLAVRGAGHDPCLCGPANGTSHGSGWRV